MTTDWSTASIPSTYEAWDRTATIKVKVGYTPLIRDLTKTHGTKITVLDYGCGRGMISRHMIEDGIDHIEAVDTNEEAIKMAINQTEQKSINYQVIKSAQIPFTNDYFDATICSFVFVNIHNRDEFANIIADIYRTLKPGGTFYILDLNSAISGLSYPLFRYGDPGVVYHDGEAKPSYLRFPNGDVWNIIDTYWSRSTYEDNLRSADFTNLQTIECNGSHLSEQERSSLLGDNLTSSPYLIFKASKPLQGQKVT